MGSYLCECRIEDEEKKKKRKKFGGREVGFKL